MRHFRIATALVLFAFSATEAQATHAVTWTSPTPGATVSASSIPIDVLLTWATGVDNPAVTPVSVSILKQVPGSTLYVDITNNSNMNAPVINHNPDSIQITGTVATMARNITSPPVGTKYFIIVEYNDSSG